MRLLIPPAPSMMLLNLTERLEAEVREVVAATLPGEKLTMPWGEQIEVLGAGETTHLFPLTMEQANQVRAVVAGVAEVRPLRLSQRLKKKLARLRSGGGAKLSLR